MKSGFFLGLDKDEYFLMNHVVVVVSKSKWFNFAKVRYKGENADFWIDAKLLKRYPDTSCTINLHLLEGTT